MKQEISPTIIAAALLVVMGTGIIVLTLMNGHETGQPVLSGTGGTADPAAPVGTSVMTPLTTTAPETPAAGQPAPAPGSSDGVILLDPVGDVYDGQEYLITGTTRLPAGTSLLLQLMPDTGTAPNGTDKQAVGGRAGSTAWITEGDGTANRIRIRGSMGGQAPGKWVALVGEMKGNYSDVQVGDHYGYAYFNLKQAPGSGSSVDPADRSSGKAGDACTLVPIGAIAGSDAAGFTYQNTTVFTAVSAGNYSYPFGKKDAGITIDQAKVFAQKAFPHYSADRVGMEYSDGSDSVRGWNFDLYKDSQKIVMGTLDADTGDLRAYFIPTYLRGEQQGDSHPDVTMDSARVTAENEIRERNGELPLKLVESRLDSPSPRPPGMEAAGNYVFLFRRIIHGVPCNTDGFTISVDSGTGNVVTYYKSWHTPENAVAAQPVPAIPRDAAIAVIEREAKACYPDSADSFRIVSADLQWMDLYNPDKFTPSPGVIPLAWYVRFDDKTIREREFPVPEEGSVDAQNGTLLSMYYVHHH
jgi:hypothetical protein